MTNHRCSFEVYKSTVCHKVKELGDIPFIIKVLKNNTVRKLFEKRWYPESLYLLAMVDYLSRINGLPICSDYNDIRCRKLMETIYPSGVLLESAIMNDESIKEQAIKSSIPEFIQFNIVEAEVRNVV